MGLQAREASKVAIYASMTAMEAQLSGGKQYLVRRSRVLVHQKAVESIFCCGVKHTFMHEYVSLCGLSFNKAGSLHAAWGKQPVLLGRSGCLLSYSTTVS